MESQKIINDQASSEEVKREAKAAYDANFSHYQASLGKAFEEFTAVETYLTKAPSGSKLNAADAELLRRTSLLAADCAYFMGNYDDAVTRYDQVATRYENTVTQLEALKKRFECYQYKKDTVRAVDTFIQMQTAFGTMPATEFDGSMKERRRRLLAAVVSRQQAE